MYRLQSPHLKVGVWNSETRAFYGIKPTWKALYFDTEATPVEFLGVLPEGVTPRLFIDVQDTETNRSVGYDTSKNCWIFLDTGEASDQITPILVDNDPLISWLQNQGSNPVATP